MLGRSFFLISGVFILGYVTATFLEARIYQSSEARKFEQARQERNTAVSSNGSEGPASQPGPLQLSQQDDAGTEHREPVRTHPAWGRIDIPAIGLSAMIMEGVDGQTLQRAVGHIPGTALAGGPGNIGLAGHRDTFFRSLRNIHQNDEIKLETLDGSYRYRVASMQVVDPGDIAVLSNDLISNDVPNSAGDSVLTLVTCYPFSFVGAAPQRFVVWAIRVQE
ncbi:MAG TPA: class D sortase [Candidatus Saccharimonadales bacterium]|jgi:sortase A|nr:class D sortase [Candidatus Saccharimonadales bacterium]